VGTFSLARVTRPAFLTRASRVTDHDRHHQQPPRQPAARAKKPSIAQPGIEHPGVDHLSVDERKARGKSAREHTPLSSH
jgi:hypothetical protein